MFFEGADVRSAEEQNIAPVHLHFVSAVPNGRRDGNLDPGGVIREPDNFDAMVDRLLSGVVLSESHQGQGKQTRQAHHAAYFDSFALLSV